MLLGLLRTFAYIIAVWFIWRWLDRTVGGRSGRFGGQRPSSSPSSSKGGSSQVNPDDSKEGEYVDFEELKD